MDTYVSSTSALTSLNVSEFVMSPSSTDVMSLSSNDTLGSGYVMRDVDQQRIIIIAVIMAFTLIGNMTLILVLLCKRSRRIKRVNILLLNLAFGDLAVAMFVNSTEILFLAFGDWALGPVMCKISVYVQMICLSSATNLLTAMSIDRYQVIVKPMQTLARRPRIWLKIAIAWTLSLIFPIPQLFIFVQYNDGLKYDGSPKRICGSRGYTSPWQRKVYFTFTTSYILIVPMAIMLYCYVQIIRVVWVRASNESRRRPSGLTPPPPPATTPTSTTAPMLQHEKMEEKENKNENSDVGCGCDGVAPRVRGSSSGDSSGGGVSSSGNAVVGRGGGGSGNSVRWARNVKENRDKNDNAKDKVRKLRHNLSDDDLNPGSPRMSVRRSLVTASKRRALIMTLTVVLSFLVCHTPYFFVTLVRIYSDYKVKMERFKIMSEFMVLVHSTLNPVLYGLFTLRKYHLKYILAFLTCSRRPGPPHSYRSRQLSDEKNKLLSSVRTRLNHHHSTNADSLTAAPSTGSNNNSNTNVNNITPDRKSGHQIPAATETVTALSSPPLPSSSSPPPPPASTSSTTSSRSILRKFRCKPLARFQRGGKKKHRGQDALLFANTDAIHLTRHIPLRPEETENTDIEPPTPSTPTDFPSTILFTNTHTVKTNGSTPSIPTASTAVVNRHDGCDVKVTSGFSEDNCDVTRNANAIPWTPQDDEFMLGGLSRV